MVFHAQFVPNGGATDGAANGRWRSGRHESHQPGCPVRAPARSRPGSATTDLGVFWGAGCRAPDGARPARTPKRGSHGGWRCV